MKGKGELGELEDWKACDTTLVIFLVLTWIREIFTGRVPNRRSDDKEEKQAKKDYYEASDSVLQTSFLVRRNRF